MIQIRHLWYGIFKPLCVNFKKREKRSYRPYKAHKYWRFSGPTKSHLLMCSEVFQIINTKKNDILNTEILFLPSPTKVCHWIKWGLMNFDAHNTTPVTMQSNAKYTYEQVAFLMGYSKDSKLPYLNILKFGSMDS